MSPVRTCKRTVLTVGILAALLPIVGCGTFTLAPVSPLDGTWYVVTRNPGVSYSCKLVFDYTGDLTSLTITSVNGIQRFIFNGQPYQQDGGYQTARATTTLTGDDLLIKAHIEQTEGKFKGVTYLTVEATVRYGEMSGTLKIAPPNDDPGVFIFDGSRR